MGNKIITEKDFWVCTEGNIPSQLQGTRLGTKKKSGEVYITVEDKATCTSIDFGCKKHMLLMAIVAALTVVVLAVVGVLTIATGGAAIIALGAIAGAVGAAVGGVIGGLLCGHDMREGREWTGYKKNFISQGSYTITGDSQMTCKAGGVVTFAPHIKSWSQAIALGGANFIGGVFEGMLAGAAIGMTGGALSGGAGALSAGGIRGLGQAALNFAKSMPKNFYVNAVESVSKFGLTLRGVMGAQGAAQQYGETGELGMDTASATGKGIFGMEIGLYESVGNIFSGKATWHDITGLALAVAPVGKGKRELEEALSNKEAEGKAKDSETTKDGEESTQKVKNQEGETKKQEGDGDAFEANPIKFDPQKFIDDVTHKAQEIIESNPSKKDRGPCLSGVYDPATGKTFFAQNFKNNATGKTAYEKWLTDPPEMGGADPIIKKKVADYEAKMKNGEIIPPEYADHRLAAHSEIRAYDEAIKARREAGINVDKNSIKEMELHNRDLWNIDENNLPQPKKRCPHCTFLTDGINTHSHN